MADHTKIEWTDATWNPVTGCSKVSAGCKHCYARRDWARLAANPKTRYFGRAFENVQCHPDVLDMPLRWRRPRRIFVNSMSDLFHEDVPDQFIADVFAYMAFARHHSFQVLTKRPERMVKLLTNHDWIEDALSASLAIAGDDASDILGHRGEFDANRRTCDDIRALDPSLPLANVWLGVSVEDQATADERIPLLLQTPAAVRWISAEPLLGPVDLTPAYLPCPNAADGLLMDPATGAYECCRKCDYTGIGDEIGIDWVVAGGESGTNARPMHPAWARSLRDQCAAAGVPFLFKQWGEWLPYLGLPVPGQYTSGGLFLRPDGRLGNQGEWWEGRAQAVDKVGKKVAGRLLDGKLHEGYPVTP